MPLLIKILYEDKHTFSIQAETTKSRFYFGEIFLNKYSSTGFLLCMIHHSCSTYNETEVVLLFLIVTIYLHFNLVDRELTEKNHQNKTVITVFFHILSWKAKSKWSTLRQILLKPIDITKLNCTITDFELTGDNYTTILLPRRKTTSASSGLLKKSFLIWAEVSSLRNVPMLGLRKSCSCSKLSQMVVRYGRENRLAARRTSAISVSGVSSVSRGTPVDREIINFLSQIK